MKGEFIKVSEELPPENTRVIIWNESTMFGFIGYRSNGEWYNSGGVPAPKFLITHWFKVKIEVEETKKATVITNMTKQNAYDEYDSLMKKFGLKDYTIIVERYSVDIDIKDSVIDKLRDIIFDEANILRPVGISLNIRYT